MNTDAAASDVPDFLYGTAWKEEETRDLTRLALQTGFRGIDTANQRKHYHEAAVGEAVQGAMEEGLVERSDLFLQTKFTHPAGQDHRMPYDPNAPVEEQVRQSLQSSLDHLGVERVDSLLLHGPASRSGLGEEDRVVWRTFETLLGEGTAGSIGVSNVTPDQLEELLELAEHPPAFVQNRCFARTAWDRPVRSICSRNDLRYQGFSLLTANQRELQSETLRQVAQRHDRTVPQIVFRFALEVGMVALTGTTSEQHMKQDLACGEFSLDESEVADIEELAFQ